jgi:membrane dipeptidase
MNRIGMMVDISHVSDKTYFDVLEITHAPVIASHSSARAVADHPRNMTDAMLEALAKNGGVVMINFYPAYIDALAGDATDRYFDLHAAFFDRIDEEHADDPAAQRRAWAAHYEDFPVPQTSLAVLLDHFDHAIEIAGPEHVGIGADWDGVDSLPIGMHEVNQLPDLTRGLLARGHSEQTIRKVLGENLLRVMKEVEVISEIQ